MTTMYVIMILALVGAAGMVAAFFWTVRSGQLDDLDTPPRRMLLDELRPPRRDRPRVEPVEAPPR